MLVFTLLVILSTVFQMETARIKVTNEDIRDAILTLLRQEQTTNDKLERHEYGAKHLGEHIKKVLFAVDKRTKLLDIMKTNMVKLEERLIKIEFFLSSNAVKSEDQMQKAHETETNIKDIPSILEKIKHDIIQEIKTNKIEDSNNEQKILTSKVDNLSTIVQQIQNEIVALKNLHQDAQILNQQTNEDILKVCETKLEKYSDYSKIMSNNIDQVLEKQNNDTEKVLAEIETISGKMKLLPEKQDIQTLCNSTVKSLETLKTTINTNDVSSKKLLNDKSKAILEGINKSQLSNRTVSEEFLIGIQTSVSNKIDKVSSSTQNIEKEISKLKDEQINAQQIHKQTTEQVEKARTLFDNIEDVLVKYESKLAKYNNTIEVLPENIRQVLKKQNNDTEKVLAEIETISGKIKLLPEKQDIQTLCNSTVKSLETLKTTINTNDVSSKKLLDDKSKAILEGINKSQLSNRTVSEEFLIGIQTIVSNKIDKLSSSTQNIEKEISKLKDEQINTQQIHKQTTEQVEKAKTHFDNIEAVLVKYESKLAKYNNTIEVLPENLRQAMEKQKSSIEEVLVEVRTISGQVKVLPEKNDLEYSQNKTIELIESLQADVNENINNSKKFLQVKINDILEKNEEIEQNNTSSSNRIVGMIETLTINLVNSLQTLTDEVKALAKLELGMAQIADGVMHTKRRIEYDVPRIWLDFGKFVKAHFKKVYATLNEKFDTVKLSILDAENCVSTNLTSEIGCDEIDRVCRQIGIMHQQVRNSTDILNILQNGTEVYMNRSLNVMDSMKGKIVKITDRMLEVDDNLNYLLEKLSFVTQKFNQIKTGLEKVLDEIRQGFQDVQSKVVDTKLGDIQ